MSFQGLVRLLMSFLSARRVDGFECDESEAEHARPTSLKKGLSRGKLMSGAQLGTKEKTKRLLRMSLALTPAERPPPSPTGPSDAHGPLTEPTHDERAHFRGRVAAAAA